MPAAAIIAVVLSAWAWLWRLGGVGLLLIGIPDNSVVPLTGSMDLFTIFLAARHRELWWYYALMATAGAVLGGYLSYGIARKGGKEALEKRLSKRRAEKVYKQFERWGFYSVAVGAILPPPFPLVPVLFTAGALQYSRKKFIAALALGRSARYTLLAGLGALYGTHIVRFFSKYYKPALIVLLVLAAGGGIVAYLRYRKSKKTANGQEDSVSGRVA